jgi:hypothetical protein
VLDENNNSTVYVVDKTDSNSVLSKVDAEAAGAAAAALEKANDAFENANDALENANDALEKANDALEKAEEAKGVANGGTPKIEGITFSHRDSTQTSLIENGRVTIQDDKTATAGINKIGQVEPMGLTALYDTGKTDSDNKKIKQWTTLCINPAQITTPKIQHIIMYLSNNIVLRNGAATKNSTIYLNHLGYHNISNIKIYDYTDSDYDPDTYEYSDGAWNQSAIDSTREAEFDSVDTTIGKIKVLNEVGAGIDWSKFKIEFDVEMEENYVYLPQKSGTIALAENMPTFELRGNTLNITLPE